MKFFIISVAFVYMFQPDIVAASDIGEAKTLAIEATYHSKRGIFDLERCIINVDSPGVPSVYRQPDLPNKSLIAYSFGVGVALLVELTGTPDGTTMDIRTPRIALHKRPIPKGFKDCI